MAKAALFNVAIVLWIATLIVLTDTALAAKKPSKPTFEEAWRRCKVQVDRLPGDQHNARYAKGAGCMLSYGYQI
jgi:hypothetical protein